MKPAHHHSGVVPVALATGAGIRDCRTFAPNSSHLQHQFQLGRLTMKRWFAVGRRIFSDHPILYSDVRRISGTSRVFHRWFHQTTCRIRWIWFRPGLEIWLHWKLTTSPAFPAPKQRRPWQTTNGRLFCPSSKTGPWPVAVALRRVRFHQLVSIPKPVVSCRHHSTLMTLSWSVSNLRSCSASPRWLVPVWRCLADSKVPNPVRLQTAMTENRAVRQKLQGTIQPYPKVSLQVATKYDWN